MQTSARLAVTMSAALAIASLAVAPAAAAVPESYTIVAVGPAESPYSIAYGISDSGQVAMHVQLSGGYTAYRWVNGSATDLDDLDTGYGPQSKPRAINSDGRVVGESGGRAVIWDSTGVTPITAGSGEAWDVNESGTVVGVTGDLGPPGASGPFTWDGGLHALPLPDGTERGGARAINEGNEVVGVAEDLDGDSENPGLGTVAVMWSAAGTPTVLDVPVPPGDSFYGQDVNEAGQILVASSSGAFVGQQGSWTNLGTLAPGGFFEAKRMNDLGQVVGRGDRVAGGTQTAVLYDPADGLQDLQSLLPSGSGWTLQDAFDINDSGQIVGYGYYAGQLRAFLMTPSSAPASNDVAVSSLTAAGTVGTNTTVSATDPVGTSVTTSGAGTVTILEGGNPAYGSPASYEGIGGVIAITAPSGSLANPLQMQFTFHASLLPAGFDPGTATMTRNGELLSRCDADGAIPSSLTSCVLSASLNTDGSFTIVVKTVSASEWSLVRPTSWPFSGFKAPVDGGGVVNTAKSGSTIPVKFSLGGDRGLAVFLSGYPKAIPTSCVTGASLDPIESTVTASSSGLTYDARAGLYTYTWKTAKASKGCFTFDLGLRDNSHHVAKFKLG